MKKEYMKPEVNEIAVEANQAIAACAYISSGNMCNGDRQYGSDGFPTAQEAWEHSNCVSGSWQPHGSTTDGGATYTLDPVNTTPYTHNNHWIFPTYHMQGEGFEVWIHDVNKNGIFDDGENSKQTGDFPWDFYNAVKGQATISGVLS